MNPQNGLYAVRRTHSGTQNIFVAEEILELEKINARVKANCRRVAQTKARDSLQKKNLFRFFVQELKSLAMCAVVFAGKLMGYVDWAWAVPVMIAILAVVCFRAGKYLKNM